MVCILELHVSETRSFNSYTDDNRHGLSNDVLLISATNYQQFSDITIVETKYVLSIQLGTSHKIQVGVGVLQNGKHIWTETFFAPPPRPP